MKIFLPENNQILAIIPSYTPLGEQTLLYVKTKKPLIFNNKSTTIVRRLAARQAIDLYRLKTKAADLTKTALWQPLAIDADLLLVPLKIRKPKVSGDSTTGYFNFHEISHAATQANTTFVTFKNELALPVLWTKKTVDEHLQKAHLIALEHKNNPLSLIHAVAVLLSTALTVEHVSVY